MLVADRVTVSEIPSHTDPRPLRTLLTGLAGHLPDELLTTARSWLAEGRAVDVVKAVAFAAVHQRVPLTETARDTVIRVLLANGLDPVAVRSVQPSAHPPALPFTFGLGGWRADDQIDDAAATVVSEHPGAHGLWRAWRAPIDNAPWPEPKRVYLVQASEQTDLVALTALAQHALEAAGEPTPQVESYAYGEQLPAYQLTVRRNGELLWVCPAAVDV